LLGDPITVNDIQSSRLYRLLPDYAARRRPAFIVYPSRRHMAQRTRVVIDFLIERFKLLENRLRDGRTWGENQGCSTLSTVAPLEQGIEATQSGGVSVLAEGADLVGAQNVVAEAAQPGEDTRVVANAGLVLQERYVARVVQRVL